MSVRTGCRSGGDKKIAGNIRSVFVRKEFTLPLFVVHSLSILRLISVSSCFGFLSHLPVTIVHMVPQFIFAVEALLAFVGAAFDLTLVTTTCFWFVYQFVTPQVGAPPEATAASMAEAGFMAIEVLAAAK